MRKTIYAIFAATFILFGFAACNNDQTDTESMPADVISVESGSNEIESSESEYSSTESSESESESESDGFGADSNGNVDLPIIPW